MKTRFLIPLLLFPLFSSCGNNKPTDPLNTPLYFKCLSNSATIVVNFAIDEESSHHIDEFLLESSKDNKNWTKVEGTDYGGEYYAEIPFNKNEKVYFRSDNHAYDSDFYLGFESAENDDEVAVGGNVMSLLGKNNFATNTTLPCDSCFYMLFCENNNIVDASDLLLPALTLTKNCYYAMFSSDIKLKVPPKLPATTLAETCYEDMFNGCSALHVTTTGEENNKIFTCPEGGASCCEDMFENIVVEDNQTYYYQTTTSVI